MIRCHDTPLHVGFSSPLPAIDEEWLHMHERSLRRRVAVAHLLMAWLRSIGDACLVLIPTETPHACEASDAPRG